MLINSEIIFACTTLYLAVMFYIAYRGDRQPEGHISKHQPIIYALSLTVYCSSWTFYGAVGNAAHNGWDYFSIYLGPILVFVFFYPFIKKIIAVSKRHKTTTIADFIATRYGKSNRLAALVTIIALLGSIPYIALQLKAIAAAYDTLTGVEDVGHSPFFTETAFVLAFVLAVFSILFGARTIDASEHHRGMLHAIGFESIVKLFSFVAIAILAFNIIEGVVLQQNNQHIDMTDLLMQPFTDYTLSAAVMTKLLLAAGAIICLPRQFHVLAVEARGGEDLARWAMPMYLLLFSFAVVPITAAGSYVIHGLENADLYVLLLPMQENSQFLAIISYLGGFAAATSMVIVANIALSTMVSNDLIFPILLRYKRSYSEKHSHATLLFIRRSIIFILMFMSYGYFSIGGTEQSLQGIGLISFAAAIQFLPSIVGGLYWQNGHRNGAFMGLICGFSVWLYCLLLPSLAHSAWMPDSFLALINDQNSLFNPYSLLGVSFSDSLTHGVIWSLSLNILAYIYFSKKSATSLTDRLQATAYVEVMDAQSSHEVSHYDGLLISDLIELCSRFTGEDRTREYFIEHGYDVFNISDQLADLKIQALSEQLLARSIGSATAEHLIRTASKPEEVSSKNIYKLIDQTGQAIEFNRELLQVTLDHIGQAVSVVDQDLRLVAWNRLYIELFDYSPGYIRVGKPIQEVIRYNVYRGYGALLEDEAFADQRLEKCLAYLKHGEHYSNVRDWRNGLVIQTEGARLSDGGFITTYTDITPLKMAERRLAAINETLEAKVVERTEMISAVNQQLEDVINSKTHFLAAASHDLVQPLNASKLYLGALLEDLADDKAKQELARNSLGALTTAESLLKSLLHLSKLDSGVLKPDLTEIKIQELFNAIENEFSVLAQSKGIGFKVISAGQKTTLSDRSLLLSVLQNLVSNAIRYTSEGRVILLCRRAANDSYRIEVKDSGVGILQAKQEEIFHPFKQIDTNNKEGVGLGLAICRQASILLGHMMEVNSLLGQGSTFSVTIPKREDDGMPLVTSNRFNAKKTFKRRWLEGKKILCADDDHEILKASQSLLERWGAEISCVDSVESFHQLIEVDQAFDIVLMDYQLGGDENGLELLLICKEKINRSFVGVLVTAVRDSLLQKQVVNEQLEFLAKPVEPAKLRSLLQSSSL